jgi:protein gp37
MRLMVFCSDVLLILTKRPERLAEFVDHYSVRRAAETGRIWLGVTVESQKHAARVLLLLTHWPGKKFVSVEPCLESVDLGSYVRSIDWVIVGGETGPGAGPCHPEWVRLIRQRCLEAVVPFFFKGWGEWAPAFPQYGTDDIAVAEMDAEARLGREPRNTVCLEVDGSSLCGIEHGKYWCTGQPRPECRPWWLWRVGRKKAGRLLDGRTWDEFPEVRT